MISLLACRSNTWMVLTSKLIQKIFGVASFFFASSDEFHFLYRFAYFGQEPCFSISKGLSLNIGYTVQNIHKRFGLMIWNV